MNQTSLGPTSGAKAPESASEASPGSETPKPGNQDSTKYQAVLGPFTIRDLTVFGSTLILFVGSLLPMVGRQYNLWNLNNLFFLALGIILPVVVAALFAARRLQPGNVLRIGSLSIDQFASVIASFSVAFFFLTTAGAFNPFVFVGLIGSLGLLVATVLAPHLPVLKRDFEGRVELPAHIVAREAAVPTRKPATPKPATPKPATPAASEPNFAAPAAVVTPVVTPAGAPVGAGAGTTATANSEAHLPADEHPAAAEDAAPAGPLTPAATMATPLVDPAASNAATQHIGTVTKTEASKPEAPATPATQAHQTIGATVDPATRRDHDEHGSDYEAFWFAVAHPRSVIDEHTGMTAFTIEPGTWILALEDRGNEFLVQDADGRVGVLRDLSNIERG